MCRQVCSAVLLASSYKQVLLRLTDQAPVAVHLICTERPSPLAPEVRDFPTGPLCVLGCGRKKCGLEAHHSRKPGMALPAWESTVLMTPILPRLNLVLRALCLDIWGVVNASFWLIPACIRSSRCALKLFCRLGMHFQGNMVSLTYLCCVTKSEVTVQPRGFALAENRLNYYPLLKGRCDC